MGKVNKKLLAIVGGSVVATGVAAESIIARVRYGKVIKQARELHDQITGNIDVLARSCADQSQAVHDQISSSVDLINHNTTNIVTTTNHVRALEDRMTEYENRLSVLESRFSAMTAGLDRPVRTKGTKED